MKGLVFTVVNIEDQFLEEKERALLGMVGMEVQGDRDAIADLIAARETASKMTTQERISEIEAAFNLLDCGLPFREAFGFNRDAIETALLYLASSALLSRIARNPINSG